MQVTFKKSLAVLLVTLTLISIQLVQASPLHDHLDHVSGCVLCHADSNEDALTPSDNQLATFEPAGILVFPLQLSLASQKTSSFQSRAPPSLLI